MTAANFSTVRESDLGTVSDLYLQQCAGEPIHLLGGVQPHGFTWVIDAVTGHIVQASAGTLRHLNGLDSIAEVLGTPLAQWVSATSLAAAGGVAAWLSNTPQVIHLQWLRWPNIIECSVHRVARYVVLECIGAPDVVADIPIEQQLSQHLSLALARLPGSDDLLGYFADCVAELQRLSGYQRVMMYRFLPDDSGEIVAECGAPGVEPKYLGLRFPASDIPPQARRLYELNTLRVLADARAEPDALQPVTLPDGAVLDQSHCLLRSLSDAHRVYLHNLGVRATLTLSLLRHDRLWGMIVCHHDQPRVPPWHLRQAMRQMCELMASVISLRLDSLLKIQETHWQAEFSQALAELGQALSHTDQLASGLRGRVDALRQVFSADGFGLRLGSIDWFESARGIGFHAPKTSQILDQVQALAAGSHADGTPLALTDLLTPAKRHLLPTLPQTAGLLLMRLPLGQDGFCFLTRPELVTQVRWAGRPDSITVLEQSGQVRLQARRSFAVWQEQVQGCAQAWSAAERLAVQRLAMLLGEVHSRQATRELQRQLDWRVRHDPLTGLLNRGAAESELARRLPTHGQAMGLLVINIDHFKHINHAHGHAGGDDLLRLVAQRLAEATRSSDQLARLGSDEFFLLTEVAPPAPEQALLISERVRAALGQPLLLAGQPLQLEASIGVAVYPQHGASAAALLRHATMALHEARARGRGRSVLFDDSIESSLHRSAGLQDELRQAIAQQQLRLHYQPKIDLRTRQPVGLEALVRWQHPSRGLVGPLEFIELAERCNLIGALGRWVMHEAAAQVARWQAQGTSVLPVAINVSFMQIVSGSIARDLQECCAQHQINPALLELELTESVMMENTQQTIAMMRDVSALGVKVSLDDFGTGYSSLAYVRQLPLDSLKIDRSFVMTLESEQAAQIVTRGIIGLASGLNLATIAEGVETAWQLDWLQRNGCDVGQGYLFSKPVPADELPRALADIAQRLGA